MKLPNLEDKHMIRAQAALSKITTPESLKEHLKKLNPGANDLLQEQLNILESKFFETEEYIAGFEIGFLSCLLVCLEAVKDECLN